MMVSSKNLQYIYEKQVYAHLFLILSWQIKHFEGQKPWEVEVTKHGEIGFYAKEYLERALIYLSS